VLRIRNNGKVTKIKIPIDALELIHKIQNSNVTETVKENIIKKLSGGICVICRRMPTHLVTYDVDKATRVERYCDDCIRKVYERDPVL
jgi:hypothetical protein